MRRVSVRSPRAKPVLKDRMMSNTSSQAASEAWEAYDAAALECHALRNRGVPSAQRVSKEIEAVRLHREFAKAVIGAEPA